jgi:hypothetical protein
MVSKADKPVYMAVGRYGQVIMIFPDLDVVAVTTGHKEYPLSEFAESIYSSALLNTARAKYQEHP